MIGRNIRFGPIHTRTSAVSGANASDKLGVFLENPQIVHFGSYKELLQTDEGALPDTITKPEFVDELLSHSRYESTILDFLAQFIFRLSRTA